MKITWVTRAFADYRLPVYKELNTLSIDNLTVIYNKDIVKSDLSEKLENLLGNRAIGLSDEKVLIGQKRENSAFANSYIRIPYQKNLISTLVNTEPEMMISDGFFQWTYAPLYIRFRKNIPHVMCYERTPHTERNVQWYRERYRKLAMKWIDRIICSGSLCGEYVQSIGYSPKKIHYGHMVADVNWLTEFSKSVTSEISTELKHRFNADLVFLYTGQIIPRKGIKELIVAWNKSKLNNNPETALVLIGGGDQIEEIRKLVETKNINNVYLLGKIPYNEIATYYAMADVFIIPTLEDNWSLVVPEAMSTGLPVICSKYNGCWPELVTEENGWVFDPLNNQEFVDTLEHTLDHKDSFTLMGLKSQQIVNNHSPEKAAQSIWQACNMAYNNTKH